MNLDTYTPNAELIKFIIERLVKEEKNNSGPVDTDTISKETQKQFKEHWAILGIVEDIKEKQLP